ncbi:type VI secretion system Vgr family protein [Paraliomyxa miuraensis]|uniref:type VI secretion system Vgr family protein n=1 Tax=Paraliomyxa miuraensis TaxID=376150 RepID=UPI00225BA08E|nr:type VI secretion system tip protein TssI/VgrG [Paraliomyxa miuraensis]MCX4241751.1 type VI secretion system tip protein VgrG [Paraliomyxa miuraensis]
MADDGAGIHQGTLIEVDYDFQCEDAGDTTWLLYRMRFMEDVNDCYELDLDLVTKDLSADTDVLLGASCSLEISRGEHTRTVFGIIMAVDYGGPHSDSELLINVRVVPAFHVLGQQTHSRIFQEMSVLEILEEVLGTELGAYDRTFDKGSAARGTAPRDYCVQYRETDRDFCVRLMEEEGISYCFVHDEDLGHEVLTLTYANDDFTDAQNVDGTAVVPIIVQRPDTADSESIQSFDFLQVLTSTSLWRRDYDFTTPLSLLEDEKVGAGPKGRNRRIYRHTDRRFIVDDVADRNADHLEAAQAHGKVGRGTGNVIGFASGKVFELERHVRDDLEARFLITRVVHVGECPEVLLATTDGASKAGRYGNSFRCIPVEVPLRPAQTVPKPRVYGPETAIVSGPSGEEINVDEHGRIKVQFHWEEETTYDDTSSCWVRVRQQWSGPGWGFQFIPRIGQEVVVEFLGGDPDRPLVVGTVYNGDNGYPYPLPDEKTRSGIKTDSVSGDGSNELRFEDQSGSEEVYIHCQKDFTIATENDKNQTTGHDETLTIGNDRTKLVEHDQSETVKNDKTIKVEGNHTETIVKDMQLTVEGNRSVGITKNHSETVSGNYDLTVEKAKTLAVSATFDESVEKAKTIQVGGDFSTSCDGAVSIAASLSYAVTAGKEASIHTDKSLSYDATEDVNGKSGKKMSLAAGDDLAIKTDKKGQLVAADELTIKCGDAKIVLKKNGDIAISGAKIDIKGSGAVTVKGSTVDNN